ncbi:MAG: NfeD family protein [Endomicrobium sp.]|uniref:NfeD family protein n=1 Tax=Candidatus Endomicrobiellum pyrsonymphae TaxID=1408203 RepID=UPI00357DC3F7|nr:NfeD family protein [Endomicrobium sp.]
MTWIAWIVIAVVLIIFEIATTSIFFFICLAIGSAFAAVVSCFTDSSLLQFTIFLIISILALYLVKPIFKRMISKAKTVSSNVDALIGAEAIVTGKIMPLKSGFVKVSSEIWRAESDVDIEIGEVVIIKKVSGTMLIVEKIGGIICLFFLLS